jgi:malate permease and related proteins
MPISNQARPVNPAGRVAVCQKAVNVLELLSIFVDNIVPILTVAGVGFLSGRNLGIEPKSVGRLVFNVFSPALVFYSLSTSKIGGAELGLLLLLTTLFQLSMAAIAYIVTQWQNISRIHRAGILLNAASLNAGNFGLSLVSFTFGQEVFARAIVIYIANVVLNNTLGVYIASSGSKPPRQALQNILRVPAVYATAAAFIVNSTGMILPATLERPVKLLADAAIPCMLVLLGLQLAQSRGVTKVHLVSISVALRLLISPFVAFGLALLFHLNNFATVALIMQASTPVAVITLILATEFGLDEDLTLSAILASTLLSPFTLSVLILILRQSFVLP